jgi:archaellin
MIQKAARAAIILTAFLIESALSSQVLQQESLTLTVSKGGSSLVQDNRKIAYDAGVSTIYFTDLPTLVNESTITITPNNSNGTIQILEKSFLKNGSSKYEELKNYIGKNITFDTLNSLIKTRTGKLIAYGQDYLKIKNTLG